MRPRGPLDLAVVDQIARGQAIAAQDSVEEVRLYGMQTFDDTSAAIAASITADHVMVGSTLYMYDEDVTNAWAVANPTRAFRDAGGRGFREANMTPRDDCLGYTRADIILNIARNTVVFADSTWKGYDANTGLDNPAISPCAVLQEGVRLYTRNNSYTVTNSAISNTTVTDLINGDYGYTPFKEVLPSLVGVDNIIFGYSLNDMARYLAGESGYTPATFKVQMAYVIDLTRAYGIEPIVATSLPNYKYGSLYSVDGSDRSEVVKIYATIIRELAAEKGVRCIDIFALFDKVLGCGAYTPLGLLPDGVHGASTTPAYAMMGREALKMFVPVVRKLSANNQFMYATEAGFRVDMYDTSYQVKPSVASRGGLILFSYPNTVSKIVAVFEIDEPGQDIYLGHPVWNGGATDLDVFYDGVMQGDLTMFGAGLTTSDFGQSYETKIVENAAPGVHILHIDVPSSAFVAGAEYIRTRRNNRGLAPASSGTSYELLATKLVNSSATGNVTVLFDELPISKFVGITAGVTLEFTMTMAKSTALALHAGTHGSLAAVTGPLGGILVGLDASGYLTIWESDGPGTFAVKVAASTDLSLGSHRYTIITRNQEIRVEVDGVLAANTFVSKTYNGGVIGVWKLAAGGTANIENLYRVRTA